MVLYAAAGAELCFPLNTNVQSIQRLSDDALTHPFPEIIYQQQRAKSSGGEKV
jgi:hypothetical protein